NSMNADSTHAMNNMNNNSTNNMNNNSMNADTTHAMNNMNNNSTNNMNNNSMNNNSMSNMNSNGMGSMSGTAFAALPVRESYISDDILSKIKSKYGNGTVIYDITAIRAAMPPDSSMTQQNGMSTDSSTANASANNGDSTMARNGNM